MKARSGAIVLAVAGLVGAVGGAMPAQADTTAHVKADHTAIRTDATGGQGPVPEPGRVIGYANTTDDLKCSGEPSGGFYNCLDPHAQVRGFIAQDLVDA